MTILERLTDPYGSALVGWIDEKVLYARFAETISSELGARFASRLTALVGDAVAVRYFCDSSYELDAFDVMADALLAKRNQFKLIVVRPWSGRLGVKARALAASVGCLEYVSAAAEFDARLRAAAPLAPLRELVALADPGVTAGLAPPLSTPLPPLTQPPVSERTREPLPHVYLFDSNDFEQGCFTATRLEHVVDHPRGAWICVARSDDQALSLARQAALVEWAVPRTRAPERFTVRFVDAKGPPPFDRRR